MIVSDNDFIVLKYHVDSTIQLLCFTCWPLMTAVQSQPDIWLASRVDCWWLLLMVKRAQFILNCSKTFLNHPMLSLSRVFRPWPWLRPQKWHMPRSEAVAKTTKPSFTVLPWKLLHHALTAGFNRLPCQMLAAMTIISHPLTIMNHLTAIIMEALLLGRTSPVTGYIHPSFRGCAAVYRLYSHGHLS